MWHFLSNFRPAQACSVLLMSHVLSVGSSREEEEEEEQERDSRADQGRRQAESAQTQGESFSFSPLMSCPCV